MNTPNILWICVDQQRWDCLGYAQKYPVKTPHIDQLAENGVNFTNSYTPIPVCCPARQAMICGERVEKFGALWNYNQPLKTGSLPAHAYSWAKEVKTALGYHTGFVGPWEGGYEMTPDIAGYDVYIDRETLCRPWLENYPECRPTNGFWGQVYHMDKAYAPTHVTAGEVIRLIDTWQDGSPWLIHMNLSEPHLPCTPTKEFSDMYDPQDIPPWGAFGDTYEDKPYIQRQQLLNWNTQNKSWEFFAPIVARYYAMISQIDDAIGLVLDKLKEKGQLDNTLIIYTSDHGDYCGDRRQMDKHYTMYEEITRVPHLWHCPALFAGGVTSQGFVCNALDIPATIMDILGLPMPKSTQGVSLYPMLKGEANHMRDHVLVTYNGQQFGLYSQRMIRYGDMKYVWNLTDTDELYDLALDPYELKNLAHHEAYAEILQDMRQRMLSALREVSDCMLNGWTTQQLASGRKI